MSYIGRNIYLIEFLDVSVDTDEYCVVFISMQAANICMWLQIEYSYKSPVTTLQKLSYVWEPFISILCCLKTVSSPSVDDSKIILILLIATWLQNL